VDVSASWADKLGPGDLSARLSWTWLRQLWQKATPEAPENSDVGEVTASNVNAPRNRAGLNLAYKWKQLGINWVTTYNGPVSLDDQFLKSLNIAPGTVGVGSRTYHDVQLTYDLRKAVQLYLGMDNIFNTKAPPIITGLPGNQPGTETDSSTYDAIGRRYYLGLRVTLSPRRRHKRADLAVCPGVNHAAHTAQRWLITWRSSVPRWCPACGSRSPTRCRTTTIL
jgi:outer membrane receptor protein involved in Fe transport